MKDDPLAVKTVCSPPCEKRHIGAETRMISNLIHRTINRPHGTEDDLITGTNGLILGYLAQNEDRDIYQRDLEEKFQVRRATVSKIICLMEQKGLIERQAVPQDARLKKLTITEKGRRLHNKKLADFDRFEEKLVKDIPKEKLDTFFEVCEMIKKNIFESNLEEEDQI